MKSAPTSSHILGGTLVQLLDFIGLRPLPKVREDASIVEAIKVLQQSPHSTLVYVLDANRRLLGVITQEALVQWLFVHYHDDALTAHTLIRHAVSETARDLARNERLTARIEDAIEQVLEDMIASKLDEVAVVDDDGRLLGDITMKDFIGYYMRPQVS